MRRFLQILWCLIALLTALCIVGSAYLVGRYLIVDYVSLIPQWLFVFPLMLLLGTFWGIFRRMWIRALALVLVMILSYVWTQTLDLVWTREVQNDQAAFSVMSWNTASWNVGRRDDFISLLKIHPSDVYLLQEVQFRRNPDLHGYMLENFPDYQAGHYGEFFTLSRFPLNCNVSERTGVLLGCTALTPDGPMTFVNVHLKRPFYVTNFRTFDDYIVRQQQYAALREYLAEIDGPVMIAGDFNTTANYPFIQELAARYAMNNPTGTLIWPHTFPANAPYMRIDYQFVSEPYTFCGYQTVKEPSLSDHVGIFGRVCSLR